MSSPTRVPTGGAYPYAAQPAQPQYAQYPAGVRPLIPPAGYAEPLPPPLAQVVPATTADGPPKPAPIPMRYWAYLAIGTVSVIIGGVLIGIYNSSSYCTGAYCYYYSGYIWSGIFLLIVGLIEMALAFYYIYKWRQAPPPTTVTTYYTQPTALAVYQQPTAVIVQPPPVTNYYVSADPEAARAAAAADGARQPQQGQQPVYLPAYSQADPYGLSGPSSGSSAAPYGQQQPGSYLKQ